MCCMYLYNAYARIPECAMDFSYSYTQVNSQRLTACLPMCTYQNTCTYVICMYGLPHAYTHLVSHSRIIMLYAYILYHIRFYFLCLPLWQSVLSFTCIYKNRKLSLDTYLATCHDYVFYLPLYKAKHAHSLLHAQTHTKWQAHFWPHTFHYLSISQNHILHMLGCEPLSQTACIYTCEKKFTW